jgi:hypothetical protein
MHWSHNSKKCTFKIDVFISAQANKERTTTNCWNKFKKTLLNIVPYNDGIGKIIPL